MSVAHFKSNITCIENSYMWETVATDDLIMRSKVSTVSEWQNSGRKMFVRIIVPTWQSVSFQDPTTWHRSQGVSTLVGYNHIFSQPSISLCWREWYFIQSKSLYHLNCQWKILPLMVQYLIFSFHSEIFCVIIFPHFVYIAQNCACVPLSWCAFCDWPSATKLRCSQIGIDRW